MPPAKSSALARDDRLTTRKMMKERNAWSFEAGRERVPKSKVLHPSAIEGYFKKAPRRGSGPEPTRLQKSAPDSRNQREVL
jgi:hypothetical protein